MYWLGCVGCEIEMPFAMAAGAASDKFERLEGQLGDLERGCGSAVDYGGMSWLVYHL